jgi:hypothetical protein
MNQSKETKQILLDWALEAEKAAHNVNSADTRTEWLRKARVYRDLMAKLSSRNGGQPQGV